MATDGAVNRVKALAASRRASVLAVKMQLEELEAAASRVPVSARFTIESEMKTKRARLRRLEIEAAELDKVVAAWDKQLELPKAKKEV